MTEFSSSPASRTLARLKVLHRADQAPPNVRTRVVERLERLEAPAPKRALSRRGSIGLLLLAAAATAVGLEVRSEHTRITPLPEQPAANRAAELVSQSSHSLELKAGNVEASGRGLAPEVIRAVMRDALDRFRECYEALPQPRPVVASKLNFTIGAAGNVTAGHVDSEASPALGQCLERVMLALRFPAPKAGAVTVGYPVQFGP